MKPWQKLGIQQSKLIQYVWAIVVTTLVTGLCKLVIPDHNYYLVSFVLLIEVSVLALYLRIGPVVVASTLSAFIWNYFFIPPHYTFHIQNPADILMFSMFFVIAVLNSVLTSRLLEQKAVASEREARTNAMYQFTNALAKVSNTDNIVRVAQNEIERIFSIPTLFLVKHSQKDAFEAIASNEIKEPESAVIETARWSLTHNQLAGQYTPNFSQMAFTCYPIEGLKHKLGVLVAYHNKKLDPSQQLVWDVFIKQLASVLEREYFVSEAQAIKLLSESDRLYKTLFNSISHEFRIPLATIISSVDALSNLAQNTPTHTALYHEVSVAALRLNRLLANLLNMSRLESGHLSVRLDWCDLMDLINKIWDDLKEELGNFEFRLLVQSDMPLLKLDFGLMEQVLYNIVFNATQHAPQQSAIELQALHNGTELQITISNQGPCFAPESLPKVFDKFYRSTSKTGGLGLGLSIAKGFVEAHGGTINVANLNPVGVAFVISIPSEQPDIDQSLII
jgi:K+-sensing histidine kinase KdpD